MCSHYKLSFSVFQRSLVFGCFFHCIFVAYLCAVFYSYNFDCVSFECNALDIFCYSICNTFIVLSDILNFSWHKSKWSLQVKLDEFEVCPKMVDTNGKLRNAPKLSACMCVCLCKAHKPTYNHTSIPQYRVRRLSISRMKKKIHTHRERKRERERERILECVNYTKWHTERFSINQLKSSDTNEISMVQRNSNGYAMDVAQQQPHHSSMNWPIHTNAWPPQIALATFTKK